ncbi:uncharacterized protein [Aphelocoma coerulescens]|uniref:uncharacterized protein isoform X1 n=1 Tax=Aphelocoma coerulescens TaxID=39617 RepID=UPI0036050E35
MWWEEVCAGEWEKCPRPVPCPWQAESADRGKGVPPGGSVLLEVQRRSVLEYVWVHLWGLGETLDVKFQGCSPCWSEKQWKQFAVCFFIPFTLVPWGSRKGLLVWTDGVAGRAGNPTAPVAPSSDLAAGHKDHSQVSSPGSVTRPCISLAIPCVLEGFLSAISCDPGQEQPLNSSHLWDQELWCWSSQSQLGPPLSCPWCG